MTKSDSTISCDQVLESFAMEPELNEQILLQYLKEFPQYSKELFLLSNEIFITDHIKERELTPEDELLIESAWLLIQSSDSSQFIDPLANLSVQKARDIAKALNVPRQIITAFRERTIEATSVPNRFLSELASLLSISIDNLLQSLALPPQQIRSFKAENKPTEGSKLTFERLLIDAGLSNEEIASLLKDDK